MILFVDDQSRDVQSYIDELEICGYVVHVAKSADEALQFFGEKQDGIHLVVLDIMMPYGKSFTADETELGLRTGVRLYERIRQAKPGMPVVIFTTVSDERVSDRFRGEQQCRFLQKKDCLPYQLAQIIGKLLSRDGPPPTGGAKHESPRSG